MGALARLLSFLPGSRVILAVVLVGAASTWQIGRWQVNEEVREARTEFDGQAKTATTDFLHKLNMGSELVHGLATLQQIGGEFDLEKWQEFATAMDALPQHPGLQAYGVALRVRSDEADLYRMRLRWEGFDSPRPPAMRGPGTYWPVTYAAPAKWFRASQGLDLGAPPQGEAVFQALCVGGKAGLTEPIPLRLLGANGETGFMLVYPVFTEGKVPTGPDQCRRRLRAIVFAVFSAGSFVSMGTTQLSPRVALRIFDGGNTPTTGKVVFDGLPAGLPAPFFSRQETLRFGGRTWTLEFSTLPDFEAAIDRSRSRLSMLMGAVLTLLAVLLVWLMSAARAVAQREASSVGEELRSQRERFALAMEATSDGIWERDLASNRFYVSPRFEALLGYPPGTFPTDSFDPYGLVHPEDLPRLRAALGGHLKGAPPFSVDIRICHADGHFFWVRTRGQVLRNEYGRALRILGSVADITLERNEQERAKKNEEMLRSHRDQLQEMVADQTAHLLSAKEKAEEALAARSAFLANMSHELRTPMHAILSFAHLGQSRAEKSPPEKLRDYFSRITLSGNRLLELVNDLLDLSKLEAGKMPIELRPNDLVETLSEVVDDLEALAASRQVVLRIEPGGPHVRADFDRMRMVQVMHNVLSNALKFTPAGRTVTVRYVAGELPAGRRSSDRVSKVPAVGFVVSDQGVGIPENEMEVIFEKFAQSSKTHTGAGGTGLGLAICREIVELHRGRITARNNAEGGADFEVLIPVSTDEREETS